MEIKLFWSDKIKGREYKPCLDFFQKMANRLLMGHVRYGPPKVEQRYMTRMVMEMKAYKRYGNMEHLYNIANYCLLESVAPENKKFCFDAGVDSVTRGKLGGARE